MATASHKRAHENFKAANPAPAVGAPKGGDAVRGGNEKVLAAHGEHGAKKSFHAFQHEGGKVTSHAHDHETGEHEQREHDDMAGANAHMAEHMGGGEDNGEPYDEAAGAIDEAGRGGSSDDEDEGIGGVNS